MKNDQYVLFSNCIPVKGHNRSIICDLQYNRLSLIPNDLYNILTIYKGLKISEIKKVFQNKFDETIDEYFNFLSEERYIFFTERHELFPEMSLKWDDPNLINNAILDFNPTSKYDYITVLNQLDKLNCKHIQLRFFGKTSLDKIISINKELERIKSSIISIDVLIKFQKDISFEKLDTLCHTYPRINIIYVYDYPQNYKKQNSFKIVFVNETIKDHTYCGVISPDYFSPNIKTFTESLSYNSCLNRKISIDINGNIKNCPSMLQDFGNIRNIMLDKAIEHTDFKKHWKISKDKISICKDCEFRHVCTDCRAYLEDPDDLYSKPLKCGYDPYTNKWEEWSTNPLKQKAIKHYQLEDLT